MGVQMFICQPKSPHAVAPRRGRSHVTYTSPERGLLMLLRASRRLAPRGATIPAGMAGSSRPSSARRRSLRSREVGLARGLPLRVNPLEEFVVVQRRPEHVTAREHAHQVSCLVHHGHAVQILAHDDVRRIRKLHALHHERRLVHDVLHARAGGLGQARLQVEVLLPHEVLLAFEAVTASKRREEAAAAVELPRGVVEREQVVAAHHANHLHRPRAHDRNAREPLRDEHLQRVKDGILRAHERRRAEHEITHEHVLEATVRRADQVALLVDDVARHHADHRRAL
mmetsp:Transcript_5985/g.23680  ORF Transcript_5985/g.23680 Transcript_5985/m.23680 type:complete len:284 (-) Transcript_5985:112-963(-)